MAGSEAFIASGSENGEILFWDVKSKEIVQRVSGHEGVVIWVDTCPGQSGTLVSGGLDGTVRIWVDVNEDEDEGGHVNGLRAEHEIGTTPLHHVDDGSEITRAKVENEGYDGDAGGERMSVDVEASPAVDTDQPSNGLGPDEMES